MLPAPLSPELIQCSQPRAPAKPADENSVGMKRSGFASQIRKDHLGHVPRRFWIVHLPQSG